MNLNINISRLLIVLNAVSSIWMCDSAVASEITQDKQTNPDPNNFSSLLLAIAEPPRPAETARSIAAAQTPAAVLNYEGITHAKTYSQEYTAITKKILLTGVELERFSLHFRIESTKQPKFRRLRYFLAQEAGAAGGLTFEATGTDQFGRGRYHPLQINKSALHESLATTTATSIVAGSGSVIELGSNALQAIKNKKNGYDHHSSLEFVTAKLKTMDELLAQRAIIVEENASSSAYPRAVIEGRILQAVRNAFINEYSLFYADTAAYSVYQNLFYALNASYNVIGAIAADTAYRGVLRSHLNGTANVLFIVSGGMATVTPVLSQAAGTMARKHAEAVCEKKFGQTSFDPKLFAADLKNWQGLDTTDEGTLIPTVPGATRLAYYTQSNDLFLKQFENETKTMHKLEKVALQSSILGPVIGSTLMTQGILGTYGYYNYSIRPRKQINQFAYGSVIGTVGTSMAVVGNAASLLAGYSYENKLAKQHKLPRQLIEDRLKHLDDVAQKVQAM